MGRSCFSSEITLHLDIKLGVVARKGRTEDSTFQQMQFMLLMLCPQQGRSLMKNNEGFLSLLGTCKFLPWDKQLADVCNVFNFQIKLFIVLQFLLNSLYTQFLSVKGQLRLPSKTGELCLQRLW